MSRRFRLLVNPAAAGGRALRRLPEVRAELDRLGAQHRVVETRSLAHAEEEARAAAAEGETTAALGGDGFVRPIAGALRESDTALAILPGGRGNDFARALGLPNDPTEAARVAVEGRERKVDVAEADGAPFVGIASYGIDTVVQDIANRTRFVRGGLVYLYADLRAVARWRPVGFTVTVDGERHSFSGYSAAVANSGVFGGGMRMVPHAELDDGLLDIVLISDASKLTYLRGLPKVFKGTHLDSDNVRVLSGREVVLDCERRFEVYADGDPIARTPATVRVDQTCLRVVVPA